MREKYDPMVRKIETLRDLNGYMLVIGSSVKGWLLIADRVLSMYGNGWWADENNYILLAFDTEKPEYKERGTIAKIYVVAWLLTYVSDNVTKVRYYVKMDPNVKYVPTSILRKYASGGLLLPLQFAEYLESGKN